MDSICFADENQTKYHANRTTLTQAICILYVKVVPIYTTFVMIFIRKPQGIHRRHFHIHTIKNKELFYFLNRCRVIMEQRPPRRCGGLVPRGEDSPSLCLTRFLWLFAEKGMNPGPNVAN